MYLVNRKFNFLEELIDISEHYNGLSTITQKGYEDMFMPVYEKYEDAVIDYPHELIIEIK
jgi:hypothetical protein